MARRTAAFGVVGLAVVLLAVLIVVPFLKRTFPQYYEPFQGGLPSDMRIQQLMASGRDDSAKPDCVGVTCAEGQFCQKNQCIPIYPGPGQ